MLYSYYYISIRRKVIVAELYREKIEDFLYDHGSKVVLIGFFATLLAFAGCAEVLDYIEESRDKKKQEEVEKLKVQIKSQIETDGFEATSISTSFSTAKLVLDKCQINIKFTAEGEGFNGLYPINDISRYSATQQTSDGDVTRITHFEDSFDLQEQVGDDPCTYFFVN